MSDKVSDERLREYAASFNNPDVRALATELLAIRAQQQAAGWRGVTIAQLQAAHVERQEEWCPDQKPDLSFRGNELGGEAGEAQNVIKKLERERHGWRGSRDTVEHLAEELADVIHTAILCAITAGIDLGPAVVKKFNDTSEKNGLAARINSAIEPAPVAEDGWIMHGGVVDPDLDGNTNVQVRFADGDTANGAVHDWDQNWQWSPGEPFAAGMIVAYRPISASGRDGE